MTASKRAIQFSMLAMAMLSLSGCGFHLRRSAVLPPSMAHVHLKVNNPTLAFRRGLERNLELAGVTIEDESGPGVAEMEVPVANFSNDMVTLGGYTQVVEYAVRFHVQFYVNDEDGKPIVGRQRIDMQREYSYDTTQTIGTSGQVEQIEGSMIDDMVQSIMFRLQAASAHPDTAKIADPQAFPAPSSSLPERGSVGQPGF